MRHNGQPKMRLSRLHPGHLDLAEGKPPMVRCPHCPAWRQLQRCWMPAHPTAEGNRCPGSGQRFLRDVTREQWLGQLIEGNAEAGAIRNRSQHSARMSRPPAAV